ncbi:hypothetical protein BDV93DRAFT_513644 [Ceratobasidium sp. AG-I]|nr:hypothetical protein BDV93DRAFT_513644 [Ceratobasidium sp. AG-I]
MGISAAEAASIVPFPHEVERGCYCGAPEGTPPSQPQPTPTSLMTPTLTSLKSNHRALARVAWHACIEAPKRLTRMRGNRRAPKGAGHSIKMPEPPIPRPVNEAYKKEPGKPGLNLQGIPTPPPDEGSCRGELGEMRSQHRVTQGVNPTSSPHD